MATSNGTERGGSGPSLIDDPDFLRVLVERMVQALLEEQMTAHLGAERYERGAERRGYRNGHETRRITTEVGPQTLQVPRGRIVGDDGDTREFASEVVPRYARPTRKVDEAILGAYLAGPTRVGFTRRSSPCWARSICRRARCRGSPHGSKRSSPSGASETWRASGTRSCSSMACTSRCGWRVAW